MEIHVATRSYSPMVNTFLEKFEYEWGEKLIFYPDTEKKLEIINLRLQEIKLNFDESDISIPPPPNFFIFIEWPEKAFQPILDFPNENLETISQELQSNDLRRAFLGLMENLQPILVHCSEAVETYYLIYLYDELKNDRIKIENHENFELSIFKDQNSFQKGIKVLQNCKNIFGKEGGAMFSKIFFLLQDHEIIHSEASKTEYIDFINQNVLILRP